MGAATDNVAPMGGAPARRVLVIDDDDAIRQLVVDLLTDAGYRVEQARGGHDALDRIRMAAPDLILLDKLMAEGDGTMFAEAYAKMPGGHAPIVGLCAARDGEEWASAIGAAAYVVKPFDIEHLLAVVAEHVAAA